MWGGRSRERPTQTPHRAIRSRPADVTVAVEVAVVTTPHAVTSRRIARARARMTQSNGIDDAEEAMEEKRKTRRLVPLLFSGQAHPDKTTTLQTRRT